MQILASKFIYLDEQKNLKEALNPFENRAIQLSFFQKQDFLQMNHDFIKKTCVSLNINIPTVHAPTVDVFNQEFLEIISKIKKIYGVKLISIHPQNGDCTLAMAKLKEYTNIIEKLEVILAYENFPSSAGRRKWICLPHDMYSEFNLPFLRLTFDTSHLDRPSECIKEFDVVCDKVAIVHLSDSNGRKQHQPLGAGLVPYRQFIKHLKDINFQGPVVLEYMPEYEKKLIDDIREYEIN